VYVYIYMGEYLTENQNYSIHAVDYYYYYYYYERIMEQLHRDLLRRNRVILVNGISNIGCILDSLHSTDTFTRSMIEEMKALGTETDKIRGILDSITRRGPLSFAAFLRALEISGNCALVKLLNPDYIVPTPTGFFKTAPEAVTLQSLGIDFSRSLTKFLQLKDRKDDDIDKGEINVFANSVVHRYRETQVHKVAVGAPIGAEIDLDELHGFIKDHMTDVRRVAYRPSVVRSTIAVLLQLEPAMPSLEAMDHDRVVQWIYRHVLLLAEEDAPRGGGQPLSVRQLQRLSTFMLCVGDVPAYYASRDAYITARSVQLTQDRLEKERKSALVEAAAMHTDDSFLF
jgi:hypothetical protein